MKFRVSPNHFGDEFTALLAADLAQQRHGSVHTARKKGGGEEGTVTQLRAILLLASRENYALGCACVLLYAFIPVYTNRKPTQREGEHARIG